MFDGFGVAVDRAAWMLPFFAIALVVTWTRERPSFSAGRWAALVGGGLAFGLGIATTFSIAAQHTSIAHQSFVLGISPVTNSIAAALAFRLAITGRQWIAMALGIAGMALLAITSSGNNATAFGDLLMVAWLLSFALYSVLIRFVGTAASPIFVMSLIGVLASIIVLAVSLAVPGSERSIAHVVDTASGAAWFFGEVVFGSALLAQTAYVYAVRRMGVAVATIGSEYAALAIGIVMSLLAHESWSILTVLACVLFCCALAATFVPRRAQAS